MFDLKIRYKNLCSLYRDDMSPSPHYGFYQKEGKDISTHGSTTAGATFFSLCGNHFFLAYEDNDKINATTINPDNSSIYSVDIDYLFTEIFEEKKLSGCLSCRNVIISSVMKELLALSSSSTLEALKESIDESIDFRKKTFFAVYLQGNTNNILKATPRVGLFERRNHNTDYDNFDCIITTQDTHTYKRKVVPCGLIWKEYDSLEEALKGCLEHKSLVKHSEIEKEKIYKKIEKEIFLLERKYIALISENKTFKHKEIHCSVM